MARRENRTTPKVIGTWLYLDVGGVQVGGAEWFAWLELGITFYVEVANVGAFTARCEARRGSQFWYGYRRHRTKLFKCYLGRTADLTQAHLAYTARVLADRVGDSAI